MNIDLNSKTPNEKLQTGFWRKETEESKTTKETTLLKKV